jgi:hypothetical protein
MHEVSEDGPKDKKGKLRMREKYIYMKGGRTYTDSDGVVPSKVIPDVVILELLYRFASAMVGYPVGGG